MLLLIPLFPLAGFVINACFGRRLPKSISGGLACAAMIASFAVSVVFFVMRNWLRRLRDG